jgi:hypothetical protein
MLASHPLSVALAIDGDVLNVTLLKLAHDGLNSLEPTIQTHLLCRDIGVETGTVPVTRDWLWSEGDNNAEFFGDAVKQETGHPELITHYLGISLCSVKGVQV